VNADGELDLVATFAMPPTDIRRADVRESLAGRTYAGARVFDSDVDWLRAPRSHEQSFFLAGLANVWLTTSSAPFSSSPSVSQRSSLCRCS
jgi:hypothetical protein